MYDHLSRKSSDSVRKSFDIVGKRFSVNNEIENKSCEGLCESLTVRGQGRCAVGLVGLVSRRSIGGRVVKGSHALVDRSGLMPVLWIVMHLNSPATKTLRRVCRV